MRTIAAIAAVCLLLGLLGRSAIAARIPLKVGEATFVQQRSSNGTVERVRVGVIQIRLVTRAARAWNGKVFGPTDGDVFVVVRARFADEGATRLNIPAHDELSVRDARGHRWAPYIPVHIELPAHASTSGYFTFEVPKDDKHLTFVVDTSVGDQAAWVVPYS